MELSAATLGSPHLKGVTEGKVSGAHEGNKKDVPKSWGLFCGRNAWQADLGTTVTLPGSSGDSEIGVVQGVNSSTTIHRRLF